MQKVLTLIIFLIMAPIASAQCVNGVCSATSSEPVVLVGHQSPALVENVAPCSQVAQAAEVTVTSRVVIRQRWRPLRNFWRARPRLFGRCR